MNLEREPSHRKESDRSKPRLEFKIKGKQPILEIIEDTTLAEYFEFIFSKRFGQNKPADQLGGDTFSLDVFEYKLEGGLKDLAGEDDEHESPIDLPGLEDNPVGQAFYRGYYSDGSELQDALEALELKINKIESKNPDEYTEEDNKLLKLTVLDFFKNEGYSRKTIERALPLKFRK